MLLKSSPKVMWYAADIELDWMLHKVIYPRNDIGTIDIDRLIPTKKKIALPAGIPLILQ